MSLCNKNRFSGRLDGEMPMRKIVTPIGCDAMNCYELHGDHSRLQASHPVRAQISGESPQIEDKHRQTGVSRQAYLTFLLCASWLPSSCGKIFWPWISSQISLPQISLPVISSQRKYSFHRRLQLEGLSHSSYRVTLRRCYIQGLSCNSAFRSHRYRSEVRRCFEAITQTARLYSFGRVVLGTLRSQRRQLGLMVDWFQNRC